MAELDPGLLRVPGCAGDSVEGGGVVEDVPAFVVEGVGGVELPGFAVGGEDVAGCGVGSDGDVGFWG
ncbi:hypothetical protein L083_0583 [Actinoplanes sp. N902-109]|nr:hypothetical protein L083_0583 [Actinoplanes sp. N902-109]